MIVKCPRCGSKNVRIYEDFVFDFICNHCLEKFEFPYNESFDHLHSNDPKDIMLPDDNVNHPNHYTQGDIETIDYIKDKLTDEEFRGFIKGNVLKYVSREGLKNGDEDLKKSNWYLETLLEVLE